MHTFFLFNDGFLSSFLINGELPKKSEGATGFNFGVVGLGNAAGPSFLACFLFLATKRTSSSVNYQKFIM